VFNLQADEDIKFEICDNFCHALWQEDKTTNGTKITILSQGTYREIHNKLDNHGNICTFI